MRNLLLGSISLLIATVGLASASQPELPVSREELAQRYFGADHQWYENNIPFFECSDLLIQNVYYYRWSLYKAHIRDIGAKGFVITEFLDDVGWDRDPYSSLNDATAFHIYEGRWLADKSYVQGYISFLDEEGGNDRHFSESIADAIWADYMVDPNKEFLCRQLPVLKQTFRLWEDHFDRQQGLYYIDPIQDATEYSIASIDASGGKDGFFGGGAFRPSINSYMFANALAISRIADIAGDKVTAADYADEAQIIKAQVQSRLWNPDLEHFTDRFKANNEFVKYGEFIRGRELVGYVPWALGLPDDSPVYAAAWKRLMNPEGFLGDSGLRTNEPSYQYYMHQYRYDSTTKTPECQWNGPSWPYQTTQVLLGMANLLNNYHQDVISPADYVRILHQYASQHKSGSGFDLEEDYNPDTGAVIVGLPRSHHYNHSEFCDLVITGLCGLRPRFDNVLEINPLVSNTDIEFFSLDNVWYRGNRISIRFDRTGVHYGKGAGLSVFVNGKLAVGPVPLGKLLVKLPESSACNVNRSTNLAVKLEHKGYPVISSSYESGPNVAEKAFDGRTWSFPEIPNYWSCAGSPNSSDWVQIDFGADQKIASVSVYPLGEENGFAAPSVIRVQYWNNDRWEYVQNDRWQLLVPQADTSNTVVFSTVNTSKIRVVVEHASSSERSGISEISAHL